MTSPIPILSCPEIRLFPVWVGNAAGLFRWADGAWTRISGAPSGSIHEITLVDDQVLVATDAGLVVYGRG